jgi:hypothetical protein
MHVCARVRGYDETRPIERAAAAAFNRPRKAARRESARPLYTNYSAMDDRASDVSTNLAIIHAGERRYSILNAAVVSPIVSSVPGKNHRALIYVLASRMRAPVKGHRSAAIKSTVSESAPK